MKLLFTCTLFAGILGVGSVFLLSGAGQGPPPAPAAVRDSLIKWKLRNISDPQSHTVMENLPTCGNCHSFSRDGKTLGMDLDGSKNDKGLYAIAPISKNMTIRNQDVIRWSSFQENPEVRSSARRKALWVHVADLARRTLRRDLHRASRLGQQA